MREPSAARQRTLALQERATRFSVAVNAACPTQFRDAPSRTAWGQLVRAADSASNNLGEADDAASSNDFVQKMKIALREVKEARRCLAKLRLNALQGIEMAGGLEQEADELAAIFATIVINTLRRLEKEKTERSGQKRRKWN
jgi:four helix bundle protein